VTDIQAVSTITRADAALRAIAKATKRMRQLETDALSTFAEYAAAQENGREEGLSFDLELSPGLAAYFSDWKQRKAAAAGRELSRVEWHRAHEAVAE
jgi:hypothetical protein